MESMNLEKLDSQELITNLSFRGNKIILPEIVSKIARFSDTDEFSIKIKPSEVLIKKFSISDKKRKKPK